jgi:hypothetical protein
MQDWEYNELIEYVEEVFNNSINDGLNALQAGGRCLYEFANVIEEGETEKTIFYICLAYLQIDKGMLSSRIYEAVDSIVQAYEIGIFVNELGLDDAKNLSERIESVKTKLQTVKIIG